MAHERRFNIITDIISTVWVLVLFFFILWMNKKPGLQYLLVIKFKMSFRSYKSLIQPLQDIKTICHSKCNPFFFYKFTSFSLFYILIAGFENYFCFVFTISCIMGILGLWFLDSMIIQIITWRKTKPRKSGSVIPFFLWWTKMRFAWFCSLAGGTWLFCDSRLKMAL